MYPMRFALLFLVVSLGWSEDSPPIPPETAKLLAHLDHIDQLNAKLPADPWSIKGDWLTLEDTALRISAIKLASWDASDGALRLTIEPLQKVPKVVLNREQWTRLRVSLGMQ